MTRRSTIPLDRYWITIFITLRSPVYRNPNSSSVTLREPRGRALDNRPRVRYVIDLLVKAAEVPFSPSPTDTESNEFNVVPSWNALKIPP